MEEQIVDLDQVTEQAWIERGLPAMRQDVECQLRAQRKRLVDNAKARGQHAVCWGYLTRKTLHTPQGNLGPIRIPRLRIDDQEVRLLPRYQRRVQAFDELVAETTLQGLSQRTLGPWLARNTGQTLSAWTVGRIVNEQAHHVWVRRSEPLDPIEWAAIATDAVWGRYRGQGDAALAVGLGVRWDGSWRVLDWAGAHAETTDLYERLMTRPFERGLDAVPLVVGDGAGAIASAQAMVYPSAEFQLCLWHFWRGLRSGVPRHHQLEFNRDFWEVYNGLHETQVRERADAFVAHWRRRCAGPIAAFEREFEHTVGFVRLPATPWRHRVRTVNLAENFFRHFRRFFNRFPGFKDEAHLCRALGLYLMAVEPEKWRTTRQTRLNPKRSPIRQNNSFA